MFWAMELDVLELGCSKKDCGSERSLIGIGPLLLTLGFVSEVDTNSLSSLRFLEQKRPFLAVLRFRLNRDKSFTPQTVVVVHFAVVSE